MLTVIGQVYGARLWSIRSSKDAADEVMEATFTFDCFIVNRVVNPAAEHWRLIEAIACRVGDWVEVFGLDAETIHDAIDDASVRMRRQSVGEGKPMTAWHDDIVADSEIAAYILTGGQGHSLNKLIVVIGSAEDERVLVNEVRQRRSSRTHGPLAKKPGPKAE